MLKPENDTHFPPPTYDFVALRERVRVLESKLEVLAAMVETPPPLSDKAYAANWAALADRIEALELRQNLVESPVMLRLAEAAERQATALETKPADTDEMWELLRGLEEEYRQHSNVFPQVMKMVDYVREHR